MKDRILYIYRITLASHHDVSVNVFDPRDMVNPLSTVTGTLDQNQAEQVFTRFASITASPGITSQALGEAGEALFGLVFNDVLRENFRRYYGEAQKDRLLWIQLKIEAGADPRFRALPWETMNTAGGPGLPHIWFASDGRILFCRFWDHQSSSQLPQPGHPLRFVLFSSDAQAASKEINGEAVQYTLRDPVDVLNNVYQKAEWDKIREFLNLRSGEKPPIQISRSQEYLTSTAPYRIDFYVFPSATYEIINEAVENIKPHIVYFVGHGVIEERGALVLPEVEELDLDDTNYAIKISSDLFGNVFAVHQPALVILHACFGAATPEIHPYAGVAPQLLQRGIPVVVGMQFRVNISQAAEFSLRLMKEMFAAAKPLNVHEAVQTIRARMWRADTLRSIMTNTVIYTSVNTPGLFTSAYQAERIYKQFESKGEQVSYAFSRLIRINHGYDLVSFTPPDHDWAMSEIFTAFENAHVLSLSDRKLSITDQQLTETWTRLRDWLMDGPWVRSNSLLHSLMDDVANWKDDETRLYREPLIGQYTPSWHTSPWLTDTEQRFLVRSAEITARERAERELLQRLVTRYTGTTLSWLLPLGLTMLHRIGTQPDFNWVARTVLGLSVPYSLLLGFSTALLIETAVMMASKPRAVQQRWLWALIPEIFFLGTSLALTFWLLAGDLPIPSQFVLMMVIHTVVLAAGYGLPTLFGWKTWKRCAAAGAAVLLTLGIEYIFMPEIALIRPYYPQPLLMALVFGLSGTFLPFMGELWTLIPISKRNSSAHSRQDASRS